MKYNPNIHNRRSYRLKGHDYSQAGLYFITMCVKNRDYIFGNVINSEMVLNEIGRIADDCWLDIPKHFRQVALCEYVIMPNHMHGILLLKQNDSGMDDAVGLSGLGTSYVMSQPGKSNETPSNDMISQPDMSKTKRLISEISQPDIQQQKTTIPPEYILIPPVTGIGFSEANQNKFSKPLSGSVSVIIQQYKASVKRNCNKNNYDEFYWQSRFYDHIIRDEQSYKQIAEYIINNPKNWKDDKFFKK